MVVAVDLEHGSIAGPIRVEPSPDEVTPRRIAKDLHRARGLASTPLVSVLLGQRPARFEKPPEFDNSGLDPHQAEAVAHALGADTVALVHGPPGTGKTRTLAALIRAEVRRGAQVLALAPSHTAVDNLVLRLDGSGLDLVRLGHPARVLPELERHTLDARLETHEDVKLARRYQREAAQRAKEAARFTRARPAPGEKAGLRAEARALFAEARRLEARAAAKVLDGANVVFATLGVDPEELGDRRFSVAVVDEAGQATEAATWRAAVRAERLVLGGDHLQLPPTVLSAEALRLGFGKSLFQRLMELDGGLGRRLHRQYRMHEHIMRYPSEALYEGSLEADPSVAGHRLADLPGVFADVLPLCFLDTAGAGFDESSDTLSRHNPKEAEAVARQLAAWIEAGVPPAAVGVITPYAAQARLLREQVHPEVEVDTIDGFQGREKEAILVSLVRSNPDGQTGFLSEHRRLNVALTRARRALWVIGDGATVGADPFYSGLIQHAESVGGYASIYEHPELMT